MYPRTFFESYWRSDLLPRVFVGMPFDPSFDPIWHDVIRPAAERVGLEPYRVDLSVLSEPVLSDILNHVANAKLLLFDVSIMKAGRWPGQRNGNVMYELGLAQAVRLPEEIALIRSDRDALAFDIAGIRVQKYDDGELAAARELCGDLLEECLRSIDLTKSLKVEAAFRSLDRDCLQLLDGFHRAKYFHLPAAGTMREALVGIGRDLAVRKLLDLGAIRCDASTDRTEFAYHWTPFGDALLRRLGLRR